MKRLFDILGTLFLLSVLWAPLACLCLLQLTLMGKPIFFRQDRAGLKGQSLSILKFRTMLNDGGSDADRLTPWGKFLRSTSLDELPELWNVLRGEMSLVGLAHFQSIISSAIHRAKTSATIFALALQAGHKSTVAMDSAGSGNSS